MSMSLCIISRGVWLSAALASVACLIGCGSDGRPGQVRDEAMRAGRTAESFPAADEDYFHDMDGALPLTREEVQGRNMWNVWTGGNDRFWDEISVRSLGTLDLQLDGEGVHVDPRLAEWDLGQAADTLGDVLCQHQADLRQALVLGNLRHRGKIPGDARRELEHEPRLVAALSR